MSAPQLVLKQPTGWFAAGREFAQALRLLPDAPFKLYAWLCLHADRHTGRIQLQVSQWAAALGVEQIWVEAGVAQLCRAGVCRVSASQLEIEDRYWPYQKQTRPAESLTQADYVQSVRALFLRPACVRSAFTAADETIANELWRRGVSLDSVRQAIWLGCARRYAMMLNREIALPITSLRYFALIVEEVTQPGMPAGYWEHARRKAQRLEREWLRSQTPGLAAERPTSPEPRPTSAERCPTSPE
jgi:hypothetical protein